MESGEGRKRWRDGEDSVLMNMTDYNFTVWVVWGSLWKRWWCAGLGGGGRRRSLDGGDALEVEVARRNGGAWREEGGRKRASAVKAKRMGDGRGREGLSRARDSWRFDVGNASPPLFTPTTASESSSRPVDVSFFISTRYRELYDDREWNNPRRGSIRLTLCGLFVSVSVFTSVFK